MAIHPRPDDNGQPVTIKNPSAPTPLFAWLDPSQIATVIPEGQLPHALNGTPFRPWLRPPANREEWSGLAQEMAFEEPPFLVPDHKAPAAGAVVVEPDGRVWLVSPTNAFGGYKQTFAKGTVKHMSTKATALKEVFEESGLRVELLAHLIDVTKTKSHTRYYLARRIGGTPSAMGWESQAVHLVPLEWVKELLNMAVDHPVADRLMEAWGTWSGAFQEPIGPEPRTARQRTTQVPQGDASSQSGDTASKWAIQDADAIAALACEALKAKKDSEAIKHCKHAAVVLHYQGKPGLARFFADFVKTAATGSKGAVSPAPKSLFDVQMPPPHLAAIRRKWMSNDLPIFEVQTRFIAHLIQELEAACLRAYHLPSISDLRFHSDLSPLPWELPEYTRFTYGCMACGFVCGDLGVDDWVDLSGINRCPSEAVAKMDPRGIRLYLHTLERAEKWADCYGSPVLEALACGTLQSLAKRLLEDDSLYEGD